MSRVRLWLRSDMRVMRWFLLALYLLLILSLFIAAFLADNAVFGLLISLGVMLVAQALFIFGSGTIQLCRPIRRRRLWLPVAVAASMFTLLFAGLGLALLELLKLEDDFPPFILWAYVGINWIGWGVLLFNYAKDRPRYTVMSRLSQMIFAGSLAELIATVPAHLVVIRRPGCLVGLLTMIGISAGVSVMIFSFGPMIVLLFLRPMYRAEKAMGNQFCEGCGYDLRASNDRCPECGRPFVVRQKTADLNPYTAR